MCALIGLEICKTSPFLFSMSIAELKKTADSLNAKERQWLRTYLFVNERSKSENWKKDIAAKRGKLESGKGLTETQYKRRMVSVSRKAS